MFKETALVFDTALYKDLPQESRPDTILEDAAGLVLEAGNRPLEERINPRRFKIIDGEVVNEKGNPVFSNFSYDTEFDAIESNQAKEFYTYLIKNHQGSLFFSIIPILC